MCDCEWSVNAADLIARRAWRNRHEGTRIATGLFRNSTLSRGGSCWEVTSFGVSWISWAFCRGSYSDESRCNYLLFLACEIDLSPPTELYYGLTCCRFFSAPLSSAACLYKEGFFPFETVGSPLLFRLPVLRLNPLAYAHACVSAIHFLNHRQSYPLRDCSLLRFRYKNIKAQTRQIEAARLIASPGYLGHYH